MLAQAKLAGNATSKTADLLFTRFNAALTPSRACSDRDDPRMRLPN
jgi:hypothetical protein